MSGADVGPSADRTRVVVWVHGDVQGVGFRWWVRARALELALVGHARNLPDGRVEIVAQGDSRSVSALLEVLREEPSTRGRPGRVDQVTHPLTLPTKPGLDGFTER